MKRIINKKRNTFFTPDRHIKIYDERGIIFYDSNWCGKFKGIFYLPKGKYFTKNRFKKIKYKKRRVFKNPPNERDLKHDWSAFRIIFRPNPHKASILHNSNTIIFDTSFKKAPRFQLIFILLHEKGHNYYKTEHKADGYAVRAMLKRGYNPSQIALAPLFTLSNDNLERKKIVFEKLKKLKS